MIHRIHRLPVYTKNKGMRDLSSYGKETMVNFNEVEDDHAG